MATVANKKTAPWFRILSLILLMVGIYLFIPQIGAFKNTFTVLKHSSLIWLLAGLIAATLSFVTAAFTQFAAGNFIGKFSDHIILQFAGSFISHFLPFNLGGVNLVTKYFRKHGESQSRSIVMSIIPLIFGIITTVVMVAIISPITVIHYFDRFHKMRISNFSWAVIIIIGLLLITGAVLFRTKLKDFAQEGRDGLRSIRSIKQTAYLLLGSLAITFSSAAVLLFSIYAIHSSNTIVAVFALYVTSSLIGNIAPTPGGIGAIEAVLVVGLVALHYNLSDAAAITLIYRFFTFWLPIAPGAVALHFVNQKKIV